MLHPPFDAQCFEMERCTLELWRAAPGVIVQRARGYGTLEMAMLIARDQEAAINNGEGPLLVFCDWDGVQSYSSEARIWLTDWTEKHLASLQAIHILLHSKLLAMGVSVANLVTGGIMVPYTDRRAFEAALSEAVRAGRRRQ